MAEHGEVGLDVEGEAVHRASPVDPHADSADLLRLRAVGVDPDARVTAQSARAGDAEIAEGVDDELLEGVHVRWDRAEAEADVEDRVADELAWPVVGDIATPIGVDELGADRVGIDEDVLGPRPNPEGVHMRVLQQEQVLGPAGAKGVLEGEGVPVANAPEPADVKLTPDLAQSSASQSCDSMPVAKARRKAEA